MHSAPIVKMVFVDGLFDATLSDLRAMPHGAEWNVSSHDFSLHLSEGVSLLLLEEHIGEAVLKNQIQARAEIRLAPGATLDYLKWQDLPRATQIDAFLQVTQDERSAFRAGFISCGGEGERQHVGVQQCGARAETLLYGFCQPVRDRQHLEHAVDMLHAAPHGKSRMVYKGILDAKSKASFRGRVKVVEAGKGIEAHQANHYLLLSSNAEASSRPELEIYQDDIQCSHGATVGQLDEAALFYLQARGIARPDGKIILQRAFVADLFEKVPLPFLSELRSRLGYSDEL